MLPQDTTHGNTSIYVKSTVDEAMRLSVGYSGGNDLDSGIRTGMGTGIATDAKTGTTSSSVSNITTETDVKSVISAHHRGAHMSSRTNTGIRTDGMNTGIRTDRKPVMPCTWFRYDNYWEHPPPDVRDLLTREDLVIELGVPIDAGASGVLMWGSLDPANATKAADLQAYVNSTLAAVVQQICAAHGCQKLG
jgi:hypothetical protein